MPITFHIDTCQRCIFFKMTGVVDEWELGVAVQAVWNNPDNDPSFDRLLDASECDSSPVGSTFIQAIAADPTSRRFGRVAYVGDAARIERFQEHFVPNAGGIECRGFLIREEAMAWLGVKECRSASFS